MSLLDQILGHIGYTKKNNNGDAKRTSQTRSRENIFSEDEIELMLKKESRNFFPETGRWHSGLYGNTKGVVPENAPSHLNDTEWLVELVKQHLREEKGIEIPYSKIYDYVQTSPEFKNAKHDYAMDVVKWQIDWMNGGGGGWLLPDGYNDFAMFGPNADIAFRGGVVKTLTAIGLDKELVEEGLETFADDWLERNMTRAFNNEFNPVRRYSIARADKGDIKGEKLPPASEKHLQEWLMLRKWEYYQEHKASVDKYGSKTMSMCLDKDDAMDLARSVERQNAERRNVIDNAKPSYFSFESNPNIM